MFSWCLYNLLLRTKYFYSIFHQLSILFCVVSLHVNCHYFKYARYLLEKKLLVRASCFILQIEKIIKHFDYNKSERFTRYLFTRLSFLTILLVTRYSLLFPHYPALFIFTRYFSIVSRYFLLVTCYLLLVILQNLLFTSICFETNNETWKT